MYRVLFSFILMALATPVSASPPVKGEYRPPLDDGVYRPDYSPQRLMNELADNLVLKSSCEQGLLLIGATDRLQVLAAENAKLGNLADSRDALAAAVETDERARIAKESCCNSSVVVIGESDPKKRARKCAAVKAGILTTAEQASLRRYLGQSYIEVAPNDYGKAIENFREYLKLTEHRDTDGYFYLGSALALNGQFEEAARQAEKAVALTKPPRETHYRLLLHCYDELGRHEDAEALLERMVRLFPGNKEYAEMLKAARTKRSAD